MMLERLLVVLLLPTAAIAQGRPDQSAGRWQRLPAAPITADAGESAAWTGNELLVFAHRQVTARDARGNPYVAGRRDVAAAYDPAARSWRRLAPPQSTGFMNVSAAWTGRELLVWGQGTRAAFVPATNSWRRLPASPLLRIHDGFGLVAWTGRELIGWGGGCCGDAFSDGVAYNPTTNRWRALARSPLAGSQHPLGAWTGRELIVLVGDRDPDGAPWPTRFAHAAAYNPTTNAWRRIAPLPVDRADADAVWDGHELLVVGGSARTGFAYDPTTNRWRPLAPMPSRRLGAAAVWTGNRLMLVGGAQSRAGLAYDPRADRWTVLPRWPLAPRRDPAAVWTGRTLIVWSGNAGAVYTP